MPKVMVPSRPYGLPMATTNWPGFTCVESATVTGRRLSTLVGSILMTARSLCGIAADQLCGQRQAVGEGHRDAGRAVDHVVVGHDMALVVPDEAGTERSSLGQPARCSRCPGRRTAEPGMFGICGMSGNAFCAAGRAHQNVDIDDRRRNRRVQIRERVLQVGDAGRHIAGASGAAELRIPFAGGTGRSLRLRRHGRETASGSAWAAALRPRLAMPTPRAGSAAQPLRLSTTRSEIAKKSLRMLPPLTRFDPRRTGDLDTAIEPPSKSMSND